MDTTEKALEQDKIRTDLLALDIQSRQAQADAHAKLVSDSIENSKAMTELLRAQNAAFDRIAAALEKLSLK